MFNYTIQGFSYTPVILQRMISGIDPAALDFREHKDRFTIREVIGHMLDFEPIFFGRTRGFVEIADFKISPVSEEELAKNHNYSALSAIQELEEFAQYRQEHCAYLEQLQPQDWQKSAYHPTQGMLTLEQFISRLVGHDLYHIEQVSEFLNVR